MTRNANSLTQPPLLPGTEWPVELIGQFQSQAEWSGFYQAHSFISNPAYVAGLANVIQENGFHCPFLGRDVAPSDIQLKGSNHREGIRYRGLNSRLRAVWMQILMATEGRRPEDVQIYAPEAVTLFAGLIRSRYEQFIGSEKALPTRFAPEAVLSLVRLVHGRYARFFRPKASEDSNVIKKPFPIRLENLLELSFSNDVFDVVVVNDIFEHVPDIDRCLSELARVTRSGGHLISTFPFNIGNYDSIIKAHLKPEGIEYLTEPEYHGNPVDPKGSLVFEIPGWNILDRARAAGWKHVEMVYHTSVLHGILGGDVPGILMLVAKR
jgi:SAM-dependent methyltransferase